MKNPVNVYLERFSGPRRKRLEEMRSILQEVLPHAEECISYGMPAYRTSKVLVYFAGHKDHIGFYPTSSGIRIFEQELGRWNHSKGAIQFPYDEKLPKGLIKRIARMRMQDAEESTKKRCLLKNEPKKMEYYEQALTKMEPSLRNSGLSKPALRALIDHSIMTIKSLKKPNVLSFGSMHGIGPHAMRIIMDLRDSND